MNLTWKVQIVGNWSETFDHIIDCQVLEIIVKLLALTNLNLILTLADLVTNLTKPSLDLDKSGPGVYTINKQTTTTTTKLFKGGDFEFLLSDCSKFQREDQFNAIIKQANPQYSPPPWQDEGGMGKKTTFAKIG